MFARKHQVDYLSEKVRSMQNNHYDELARLQKLCDQLRKDYVRLLDHLGLEEARQPSVTFLRKKNPV